AGHHDVEKALHLADERAPGPDHRAPVTVSRSPILPRQRLLGLAVLNQARCMLPHLRPAGLLEICRDAAAAPFAVASLIRDVLMTSATIAFSAVEEHDVLAAAHKLHVGMGAGFRA